LVTYWRVPKHTIKSFAWFDQWFRENVWPPDISSDWSVDQSARISPPTFPFLPVFLSKSHATKMPPCSKTPQIPSPSQPAKHRYVTQTISAWVNNAA